MITKEESPSYGYRIKKGATSLHERIRLDPYNDSSHNHHFLGDIISWFVKNLVGIRINPHEEDADEILLAPKFIDALDHAQGS